MLHSLSDALFHFTSHSLPLSNRIHQRSNVLRTVAALLLLCLVLAACGPETADSDEDLTAATQRIALEFQASNNLDQARAALEGLDVANQHQWLLLVTENAVQQNSDPNTTIALVKLTEALGLDSATIEQFAVQNNLVANAQEPAVSQVAEQPTAEPVQPATGADNNAQPAADNAAPVVVVNTPTVAAPITPTVAAKPVAKAIDMLNVRGGPGTEYNLMAGLQKDETAEIVGKNPEGNWWQVQLADGQQGWVMGELVAVNGDTAVVAVAADIPVAPTAAPTPVQVAEAPPAQEAAPPAAEPPAAAEPEASPAPEAAPTAYPNAAPYFTLASRRMWSKEENGGCVGQHLLRIHVVDANGAPLNGIRLKGIYIGEELVTGDQGKGEGIIEYDLHGSGEGFFVLRNNDGRDASSDRAEGFTTRSLDISEATLIEGGYCSNSEDCRIFYSSYGCQGHHSYEATFKRNY